MKIQINLTRREQDCLRLITAGKSSQEAGELLNINKRTVDYHLGNVYNKLGARNRMEAYHAAQRLGLLK